MSQEGRKKTTLQMGFTLIEVVVSLAVLSLSLVATVTVYESINSTVETEVVTTETLQDARTTLQRLSYEIRKAGYRDPNKSTLGTPTAITASTSLMTTLSTPATPNTNLDITMTSIPAQSVSENNSANQEVVNLSSYFSDDNTLSYRVLQEEDHFFFSICNTSRLCIKPIADFEQPSDVNLDNNYKVRIAGTDTGGHQKQQTINVSLTNVTPSTPTVTEATSTHNTMSTSGLVISASSPLEETTHYKISNIPTWMNLYLNDGTTSVTNDSYLTKAQGTSGLKFTPTVDP